MLGTTSCRGTNVRRVCLLTWDQKTIVSVNACGQAGRPQDQEDEYGQEDGQLLPTERPGLIPSLAESRTLFSTVHGPNPASGH
jgi:hypothetical protein